ncbi:MAG: DUF423 domain-containing protein [Nitrospirota bacterium]|nr:DUF423 domain-containing protein [Nitrospirota bacterium]MDH5586598.1 DUF423 domain-containing protein [Nitrospirota bacterium]
MTNRILIIGAIMAGIGVAAGAFGAHGLRPILSEKMMAVFETGVRYHLVHAMAMLIAGLSAHWFSRRVFLKAGWSFFLGIFIFSGSLYALALTDTRTLGILTPLGGLAFLIGWGFLAWGYWKSPLSPLPSSSKSQAEP